MSTVQQDDLTALIQQAAAQSQQGYAPAWMPKKAPETIAGTIVGMDSLPNTYGDPYPVITIQTLDAKAGDKGRFSVHGFHTALSSQLTNVKMGDVIGVTYLGKQEQKEKKKGVQAYENYRVALFDSEGKPKPTRDTEFDQANDAPSKNDKISHPPLEGESPKGKAKATTGSKDDAEDPPF